MSDEKKKKVTAGPTVTLRNNTRRPLVFRAAGQTLRLSPGEQCDVPASCLGGSELRHLGDSGLVAVARPAGQPKGSLAEPPPSKERGEPEKEDVEEEESSPDKPRSRKRRA